MRRIIMILSILFLSSELFADYITSGIGLGLRATQLVLNETKAQKKEKREAELHKQKMEKAAEQSQKDFKELARLLRFRYGINLADIENNGLFWQYAEKTIVRKGETADVTIMKYIEKKDNTNAAKTINAVVNRMKKDGKWQVQKKQK